MSKKPEFRDMKEYQEGITSLRALKERLTIASCNKTSGTGLSALYSQLKREIADLEAKVSRFRAKYPSLKASQ